HDFYNASRSRQSNRPYSFGQGFRMGDVPAGSHPTVTNDSGAPLAYQIDDIAPAWPDGSWRHCAFTVMVPPTAGGGNSRLNINRVYGSYAPASTPRTVADITAHNFQVRYRNVLTHPTTSPPPAWTRLASGNHSFSLNAALAAGRYRIKANGPNKMTVYAYGPLT